MSLVNIIMPKLGESIMEATVLKWHKRPGDMVKQDDTLLDIATDKVDSEVPSTADGILEEILYKENEIVPIGAVIARVRSAKAAEAPVQSAPSPVFRADTPNNGITAAKTSFSEESETVVPYTPSSNGLKPKQESVRFYSPLVMNIASREGIGLAELEKIPGTGSDGRVSKRDILDYLDNKRSANGKVSASVNTTVERSGMDNPTAIASKPSIQSNVSTTQNMNNVEVVEMDRMRRLIADHMRKSLDTSAHVTSFAEADVTNLVKWRDKVKKEFEKREGEKITLTPIFVEAITKCIRKYPMLNASVDGDRILLKKDINIGMATALPNGNLIVPVIRYADQLSMIGLAKQVNRLANAARNGQLSPSDIQDGTFTFTNVGTFGSLMGTPIINQPQVGILATGAIKKKPVVMESDKGDSIAIRHMMFVSLSYDHRIIDGGLGSLFLSAFVNELESFDINRSI